MKITKIALHQNPHLDEIVAVMLFRRYGEDKFPGVSTAKLVAWGKKELAQTPPEMAAMSGTILVGIGGGMFDDHGKSPRQDCAATLVAKHLGKMGNPVWGRILRDVFLADSEASGSMQSLAEEVKNLNRYWAGSLDVERVYALIEPMILARLGRQDEYLTASGRFESAYRNRIGGQIKLVAVDGLDNVQFQHVARAAGVDIIVQRGSSGLTQILGSKDLDMVGLAVRLRKTEIAKSNLRMSHFMDDEELAAVGTIEEIPHWYLEGGFLLNGSESFPDVPPSNIKFADLVHLVEKHLIEFCRPKP
ncbi:MAG: hypothetical protein WC027_03435 [Candidatus Paceibacterota bacterium]